MKDWHAACARKFFGASEVPVMDYATEELDRLAQQIIRDQTSLTGVQPKLSLHIMEHEGEKCLTIVGLWGGYICKPQTDLYPMLPEVEDLTMHLASLAGLDVVPHTLIRMGDGTLAYLTRRIDRLPDGSKVRMEDMCQLTERPTEHKYKSSYERVGKAILIYSSMPKMDVTNFFEQVMFGWLTGNNDMHLKNFSLYAPQDGRVRLAPAYDLLNVAIVHPSDEEELALTLNGRKRNIVKDDFVKAAETLGVAKATVEKLIKKYAKLQSAWNDCIQSSFLSDGLKEKYKALIEERIRRINS
jgi:serine/threonine-protein kinase HipA